MDEVLRLLGLVYKANKLLLGEEVLNQIDRVKLVFIASDASIKSIERYKKKCHFYNLEYIDKYSSEQLAKSIGKKNIKFIGVIDHGFTKTLLAKLKEV